MRAELVAQGGPADMGAPFQDAQPVGELERKIAWTALSWIGTGCFFSSSKKVRERTTVSSHSLGWRGSSSWRSPNSIPSSTIVSFLKRTALRPSALPVQMNCSRQAAMRIACSRIAL